MLCLVCPCGHSAPLPEEVCGKLLCTKCGRSQEFVQFATWWAWIWYAITKRPERKEPGFQVEWRAGA